jgi:hypothetical protein
VAELVVVSVVARLIHPSDVVLQHVPGPVAYIGANEGDLRNEKEAQEAYREGAPIIVTKEIRPTEGAVAVGVSGEVCQQRGKQQPCEAIPEEMQVLVVYLLSALSLYV